MAKVANCMLHIFYHHENSKGSIGISCHLNHRLPLSFLCRSCISEVLGTNPTHLSAFFLPFPRSFLSLCLYPAVSDMSLHANVEFWTLVIVFFSSPFSVYPCDWLVFKFQFFDELSILSSIYILEHINPNYFTGHVWSFQYWVFWVISFLCFS